MQVLHWLKVNVFKVVVLMGTFALALAFAGNDLVLIFTVRIGSPEGCRGTVVELKTPSTSKAKALIRDKS